MYQNMAHHWLVFDVVGRNFVHLGLMPNELVPIRECQSNIYFVEYRRETPSPKSSFRNQMRLKSPMTVGLTDELVSSCDCDKIVQEGSGLS